MSSYFTKDNKERIMPFNAMNEYEKSASIMRAQVYEYKINFSMANQDKNRKPVFLKQDMSAEELLKTMPYSPESGRAILGENQMLLRNAMDINNYKEPQFLTLAEAKKISPEAEVAKALDKDGKPIPIMERDANGNLTNTPAINPNTNEPKFQRVQGVRVIEQKHVRYKRNDKGEIIKGENDKPILEKLTQPEVIAKTYYHVSQFDNLDKSKLKPHDMESTKKLQENFRNSDKTLDKAFERVDRMVQQGLYKDTALMIKNMVMATATGRDYQVPEHIKLYEKRAEFQAQAIQAREQRQAERQNQAQAPQEKAQQKAPPKPKPRSKESSLTI